MTTATFIRPDGKEKVTGSGRYTADVNLTGQLHAKLRYADHTHARIVRIDTTKARALPGVLASHTILPVIGVPLPGSSLMGLDSLFSIVQMPPGIPVAAVALGTPGAHNAAYLAASILALSDEGIRERYRRFRVEQSGGELE